MPATILLIDDERDLVSLWREYLVARGHDAHVAYGVASAKRLLGALRPDIVLVDYQLADGVADDVLACLASPFPEVIVSSGRGDDLPAALRQAGHQRERCLHDPCHAASSRSGVQTGRCRVSRTSRSHPSALM